MPGKPILSFEPLGNDMQAEMSGARCRAGVSSMKRGFIDQSTFTGRESFGEARQDLLFACAGGGHFGSSSRYFARKKVWAMMKAKVNPIPPNSLKLAQVEVENV